MNGLELSRGYYHEYGKPMLEAEFGHLLPYLAVAFTGKGSEHFGFDDALSQDHDFEPGFCIFLPDENVVDRRQAFLLERAYAKLPKEYAGVQRQRVSPVGGNRNGVIRMADYFTDMVGTPDGRVSLEGWLRLPDYALAEAVNGEIFYDGYGMFSQIREGLAHMPEDVRLKRLAGNLLTMAQAGQYNFARCLQHGEPEAAQLACGEFVNAAMKAIFLLHERYMPFYKWSFRALRQLPDTQEQVERLSCLLYGDNREEAVARQKSEAIEQVAADIIAELIYRDLSEAVCMDLEKHAYSVNDHIRDSAVRNLHILAAV